MKCPQCNHSLTDTTKPCPRCDAMFAAYARRPAESVPPPPEGSSPSANVQPANWQQTVASGQTSHPQPYAAPPASGQPYGNQQVGQPASYPPPGYAPQNYPQHPYPQQGHPQQYAPQGQPPQGYAPPGYAQQGTPPQGYAQQPQGYPPQGYPPQGYGSAPGYGPPSGGAGRYAIQSQVPAKADASRTRNWIIGGVVTATLLFLMVVTSMGGKKPTAAVATSNGQPVAPAVPTLPPIPIGPGFNEVDGKMSGRLTKWTEAQTEAYWNSVRGTQVTWSGEVKEVELKGGGEITLKCNPETWTSDTEVKLDGTQVASLPRISKGSRVAVRAILSRHDDFGYKLTDGQVIGY